MESLKVVLVIYRTGLVAVAGGAGSRVGGVGLMVEGGKCSLNSRFLVVRAEVELFLLPRDGTAERIFLGLLHIVPTTADVPLPAGFLSFLELGKRLCIVYWTLLRNSAYADILICSIK